MSEHRVSVDGGKYTFVIPENDYKFRILRHGEEQYGPIGEASKAVHSMMCELDAARVVLQAVKDGLTYGKYDSGNALKFVMKMEKSIERHNALVGESMPPSEWTK